MPKGLRTALELIPHALAVPKPQRLKLFQDAIAREVVPH